ncbi:MAG: hypothetical protein JW882_09135 [Deltaproteobacteria bacterium]|nr:hypothetical protein [Deltaproteobacteria bacterium]
MVENGRSQVMEGFKALDRDQRDAIKALIINMAITDDFKSPKINNHLRGYNYGEIRPKSHRFFFFYVYGENIIFFDYKPKKVNSLGDKVYKEIDKKRERYEEEFKKFIPRN